MTFAEATQKLKDAEGKLSEAQSALQGFAAENFKSTAGGMIYVTSHSRQQLDDDLAALVANVDVARSSFHLALQAWSALKE